MITMKTTTTATKFRATRQYSRKISNLFAGAFEMKVEKTGLGTWVGINRIITNAKMTNSTKQFRRRRLWRMPILLLLLVYSIPSTSDDYILLHAWTMIYKNDLKCAKKKEQQFNL